MLAEEIVTDELLCIVLKQRHKLTIMKLLILIARGCFAAALIVYGVQQIYFGTFRDVFYSPYETYLPFLRLFAYVFGLYLIATGIMIFIPSKGKIAAQVLGIVLLILFVSTQLTYKIFVQPTLMYHIGLWTAPFKEIALAGGSFIVAYSFQSNNVVKKGFLNNITPYGNLLFLFTMTSFGISHLLYADRLVVIVPKWVPDHLFWVKFTGVTLAASSIAIALGIRIRVIALLLAIQVFLWVWMVHTPGTLSQPLAANRGNLLASAFDALAFSGIALLIALTMKKQQWVEDIENL